MFENGTEPKEVAKVILKSVTSGDNKKPDLDISWVSMLIPL
jgi:hypothetical protein